MNCDAENLELIECDNVLSYVGIMQGRGVNLTGCKEYQSVSAARLSMFMADLFPVRRKDANVMSITNVVYI